MNRILLIVTLICYLFAGCIKHTQPRHKHHSVKVHRYKTTETNDGATDVLFWYLIFNDTSGSYYYTSSKSPLTTNSFSSVRWTTSTTKPEELEEAEDLGEEAVDTDNFVEEMAEDMDDSEEAGEDSDSDSDGDSGDSDSDSGDSGSSDSGSSDSGSSDGGGDGGGGD